MIGRRLVLLLATCLCGCLLAEEPDAFVDRVNRQGLLLLQRSYETTTNENVLISPYSLDAVCSLLVKDASNPKAAELREALGLSADAAERYAVWARELVDSDGVKFRRSNVLAVDKGASVSPEMVSAFAAFPSATLLTVDFGKPGEVARAIKRQINADMAGEFGPIPLPEIRPGEADRTLVNALFFDAKWASPFRRNETRKVLFRRNDGTETPVDMMHGKKWSRCYWDEQIEAIAIPYRNPRYQFVAALPGRGRDCVSRAAVRNVLTNLVARGVRPILERPESEHEIELPRTGIEMRQDLRPLLPDIGLGALRQWARLELDEEGTRVKVATVSFALGSAMGFRAHSPFVWLICDSVTGLILVEGVVGDPKPLVSRMKATELWSLIVLLLAFGAVVGVAILRERDYRRNPPTVQVPHERSSPWGRIALWIIGLIATFLLLPLVLEGLALLLNAFASAWAVVVPEPVAYGLAALTYLVLLVLRGCCRSPEARRILFVAILISVVANVFCGCL